MSAIRNCKTQVGNNQDDRKMRSIVTSRSPFGDRAPNRSEHCRSKRNLSFAATVHALFPPIERDRLADR